MLQDITKLGQGGSGFQGQGEGSAYAALKELQGFRFALLAGALTQTKINVAALRQEDTILFAMNNNAGTLTDITGDVSIVDTHATGTITLSSVAKDETVTVAGHEYTAVATAADVEDPQSQFAISGTDTADAAALAAAINAYENNRPDGQKVTASADSAIVTVRAVADGTAGNAVALVKDGSGITLSGATLTGGTATGGIIVDGATDQVLLAYYDKQ